MSDVIDVTTTSETTSLRIENKVEKLNAFERLTHKVCQLFAWVSGSTVVLMMLLIVFNAIKRKFSAPLLGTTEMVGWLAAIAISFSLGYTQINKGHVDIDLLVNKFPSGLQRFLRIIISFLSLVFFSIVGWQLFKYALTLSANNNVSQTLGIIYYPFVILSSIGFLAFVLVLVNDFISECKGGVSNGSN